MELPLGRETLFSAVYFGTMAVLVLLEVAVPRRDSRHSALVRWGNHFALNTLDGFIFVWLTGLVGLTALLYEEGRQFGLLQHLDLSWPLMLLICVPLFDLVGYWIHRLLHAVRPLWRLHAVHHSDGDFDFSTGLRHHPLETLVVAAILFGVVILVGPPPAVLVLYLLLRVFMQLFTHSNLRLPAALDGALRRVFITPDVHRVHHSNWQPETDSNFGDVFVWWDRIFGTYRPQPRAGHEAMIIGLDEYQERPVQWLPRLLWQPFEPDRPRVSRKDGSRAGSA